jgi:hypothetical protein
MIAQRIAKSAKIVRLRARWFRPGFGETREL